MAGVDISGADAEGMVLAAVAVLSYPDLEVAEVSLARGKPSLPYIPGFLSFRETPVLIDALEGLELTPDIIITDGQGLAHPRRFGIACHIGLLADVPAIGCAKSILTGRHGPLGNEAGSHAELTDQGEVIGVALRSRTGVSPVYVSVGHKIDLASATKWVLACCKGRRLPETTRLAHQAAAGRLAPGRRTPGSGHEPESRSHPGQGSPITPGQAPLIKQELKNYEHERVVTMQDLRLNLAEMGQKIEAILVRL